MSQTLDHLTAQEYQQRLQVIRLRREVYEQRDPATLEALLPALQAEEAALVALERARAAQQAADPTRNGLLADRVLGGEAPSSSGLESLGAESTGIAVQLHLRMSHVPTAICHLLDPATHPLLSCDLQNTSERIRRLRLVSFVEGYSAQAVETVEIGAGATQTLAQLPTFFPERLRQVTELTRATLNVLVEDLDGRVELHVTRPLWLLARNAAPLGVQDPKSGEWQDMTPYFAAFVTPNAPPILKLLRQAAARHPERRLAGQSGEASAQVKALYETLKDDTKIQYVNALVAFGADEGLATQRVRLPRESLDEQQANCIDGTVLFASLLEALSLKPAIVSLPQHTFIAWETSDNSWHYLETTEIDKSPFEDACRIGALYAKGAQALAESTSDPKYFQRHPLSTLRTINRILPME